MSKPFSHDLRSTRRPSPDAFWRGVADEAKRLEAIRAQRTGRGEWYAVVEVSRISREYAHIFEHITAALQKCSTRKAAVEAGRRLMAEKIDWLKAEMEVSAHVRFALEWRPDELD